MYVKPTGLPTCLACLACQSCLSQPLRRQIMRMFPQFACGRSMELSACSGNVSAPKTERLTRGSFNGEGGVSHGTPCSPSLTHCVFGKILPGVTAGYLAEKAPCRRRRAQGWSRWLAGGASAAAGGLISFMGKCGARTFQTQGTLKQTDSVQQCIIWHASWPVNGAASQEALTRQ
jgi:hypothetical protein